MAGAAGAEVVCPVEGADCVAAVEAGCGADVTGCEVVGCGAVGCDAAGCEAADCTVEATAGAAAWTDEVAAETACGAAVPVRVPAARASAASEANSTRTAAKMPAIWRKRMATACQPSLLTEPSMLTPKPRNTSILPSCVLFGPPAEAIQAEDLPNPR